MAFANTAYRLDTYPDYTPGTTEADIRAMRTGAAQEASSPSLLLTAAKMAAIVLLVVAALAFARITLTSATVTTMIESDAISGQIQDARSTGVGLEMEQSVLSNPSAIKVAAKRLGMTTPSSVGVITLDPDVVAVDAAGDLSLSGTVKNLVGSQG